VVADELTFEAGHVCADHQSNTCRAPNDIGVRFLVAHTGYRTPAPLRPDLF